MKKYIFILLAFIGIANKLLSQNPFDSTKIKKTGLIYIVLGQPGSPEECYPSITIAPKYHFNLQYWGEPNEPWSYWDSIFKANERIDSPLDLINGKGWRERYEAEVRATYQRDSVLIQRVKGLKFIVKQKKRKNYLFYFVDSVLPNNVFRINAIGYLKDGNGSKGSYYRIFIRQDDSKIVQVDKKIIALPKRKSDE